MMGAFGFGGTVRAYTRGAELRPVAELDTRRSVTVLLDGDSRLVEIADDRVKGTAFGAQGAVPRLQRSAGTASGKCCAIIALRFVARAAAVIGAAVYGVPNKNRTTTIHAARPDGKHGPLWTHRFARDK
jgi:hypothetical protein